METAGVQLTERRVRHGWWCEGRRPCYAMELDVLSRRSTWVLGQERKILRALGCLERSNVGGGGMLGGVMFSHASVVLVEQFNEIVETSASNFPLMNRAIRQGCFILDKRGMQFGGDAHLGLQEDGFQTLLLKIAPSNHTNERL